MGNAENAVMKEILEFLWAKKIPAVRINNFPIPTGRKISYKTKDGTQKERLEFRKNPNQTYGVPDIDAIVPRNHPMLRYKKDGKVYQIKAPWGLSLKIECKTKTGRQSSGQKDYEKEFSKDYGCCSLVARSSFEVEVGLEMWLKILIQKMEGDN